MLASCMAELEGEGMKYEFNPAAYLARFWRIRRGRAWLAVGGTVRRA